MAETPRGAERILEGLNEAQAAAVTHEAGPLLIIAGAGTGKTTVIPRRIAYLIATRRARPSEILALTFTDKAAVEMEERVDTLIPYGYADVQLSTFHAFGDRLIKEHALELGLTPDFRVLTRAEQVIFLRDHLFEFPLAHYRPLGVLKRYQERFRYILVDEFQDTNYAQFELVKFLAAGHGNIAVVGDDDQAIFRWRGASMSNILDFARTYPGAQKVVLQENRRSPQA